MVKREKEEKGPQGEILRPFKKGKDSTVYIAIVIIILLTVVAMTGVYFEYW
ncbi:hypothetical protein [Christiangramia crocea]|uniref:Uncharacterized protein n=1 Tax=Christiangramia crocea TaxID=2904124 RepID=A0A9X1V053_9FLAO|nr:hypothetical protein [Gramella crocea]MCG9972418.1 hypothetical protein [Gramella crocea]